MAGGDAGRCPGRERARGLEAARHADLPSGPAERAGARHDLPPGRRRPRLRDGARRHGRAPSLPRLFGRRRLGSCCARAHRLVLGAPLALLGIVVHAIPYQATGVAVRLLARTDEEVATDKIVVGLLFYPLAWAIEGWCALHFGGAWALALFLIALLPLGFFAIAWQARLTRSARKLARSCAFSPIATSRGACASGGAPWRPSCEPWLAPPPRCGPSRATSDEPGGLVPACAPGGGRASWPGSGPRPGSRGAASPRAGSAIGSTT